MKIKMRGMLAVLAVTALAATGCGSSKSSTSAASGYPSETTSSAAATTQPATTTTPSGGSGTVITVKHASKLGTIVAAGSKHMTVYLFEGDKGGSSSCSGACAGVWPPVTTAGSPVAHGAASSDLGTITRADGTTQVTYKGHPLYFFVKDKDSGDAYGEGVHGFGADWYVLTPSGSKIDNS